ncbi:MAG: GDP-mannose 4,6-dehydratase [Nitrospinae bacterium]|nr:GDP-mannose 4,6-dehydratase [Nitrospinota bacterium]
MQKALITGITGQDGAYLAKSLLKKGIKVFGGQRRSTTIRYWRLDEMGITKDIEFVELDLLDHANIRRAIEKVEPDYVYNLAAQSFVALSFEQPELTTLIDAMGVLRCLEAIKQVNPKIKFYQASSSEQFGNVQEVPQNEKTKFWPRSPYACAKVFGHNITVNYRESYDMFACCGILFNHESPHRGEEFVTRKISKGIASWLINHEPIVLGNLEAKRDWGHAEDFVEGMQLMMNHEKPDDYVLATGEVYSIKDFINLALESQNINFFWEKDNCFSEDKKTIITTDKKFFRPAEVNLLQGDSSKAREKLGWKPKHTLKTLVKEMIEKDISRLSRI